MRGRRIADGKFHSEPVGPGDYGKSKIQVSGCSYDTWWFCTPNGIFGRLSMPEDVELGRVDSSHLVQEHADGTISVILTPPAVANSIKCWDGQGRVWHGYIRHGVWEVAD
jgi:hypothetical protein